MTEPRIEWLRKQLDEDEAAAKATAPRGLRLTWVASHEINDEGTLVHWVLSAEAAPAAVASAFGLERGTGADVAEHIARHDPARVLREVEAKRKILAEYERLNAAYLGFRHGANQAAMLGLRTAVEYLAAVYTDREGYAEHWGSNG